MRQRTDLSFHVLFHIFIVVLLVPQCSKQVQDSVACILALLAQGIDEGAVKLREEVHSLVQNFFSPVLKDCQVVRGRIPWLTLPVIRTVAKEVQAFLC
jgi:hypothetical protein